jgi:hypothetical protein
MAAYGYVRVSTSRQAEEGESLDVQQRTVAGYALMLGLTVDRMFVERGVSGSVPLSERAEGITLLAALKPGDVLITAKLDPCSGPRSTCGRRHPPGDPGCAGGAAWQEAVAGRAASRARRPGRSIEAKLDSWRCRPCVSA